MSKENESPTLGENAAETREQVASSSFIAPAFTTVNTNTEKIEAKFIKDAIESDAHLETLSYRFARTRDPQAREALILYHQKLVHYVATRFLGGGETLDDLIQVGNVGLINALDRFDPTKDVKFSTYAMPTIVGEIKRHFRDKTWQVKVPRWLQELSINVRKAQETLAVRNGHTPTVQEIAKELHTTEERVIEAFEISHIASTISLDTRLDAQAGGDSATLVDMIGKTDSGLNEIDSYSDLRRALNLLEPREREVVQMRFFDEMSQSKIAAELEISQMHVSRLQSRALQRLREILAENAPTRFRRKTSPRVSRTKKLSNSEVN